MTLFSGGRSVQGTEDVRSAARGLGFKRPLQTRSSVTWARPFASRHHSLPVREMQIIMKPQRVFS